MKIEVRDAKSIITKSNIPNTDYVINPYTGCQHACLYCYAEFMKRFTNHGGERWGEFLDVKRFDWAKIKPERYNGKRILLSSVTDPYTPHEKTAQNTRNILERLVGTTARIEILTKSKLVTRDIDLFQQFEDIHVGVSLATLDPAIARVLEPRASTPLDRLKALREVAWHGVDTWVFISPLFPLITDWQAIVRRAMDFNKEFHFENLNFRPHNKPRIKEFVESYFPDLLPFYRRLPKNPAYWDDLADEIREFCGLLDIEARVAFHHGGFSQK